MTYTLLWFRHNLRLNDNPALIKALACNTAIVPVFIYDPAMDMGSASQWWLHHSLQALNASLEARGSRLIIRHGDTQQQLAALAEHAEALVYAAEVDPTGQRLEGPLQSLPCKVIATPPNLLVDLDKHLNQQNKPFQVFSAFWRAWLKQGTMPTPTGPAPESLPAPLQWPESVPLDALRLRPNIPWDAAFYTHWTPGENAAHKALTTFLTTGLAHYKVDRNRPDRIGTSQLSPYLHFGELSIVDVWQQVSNQPNIPQADRDTFLSELGWREFSHYLLKHFPQTLEHPLRQEFARFPWQHDDNLLAAWQQGETGYPIVDAGMRQLWTTGWMHNRVRMIVASFLVKHLRQPWQAGTAWFWDTLVDADAAANTFGWQWSAGCGADAAPYFRVFNPVLQGEKFDPDGIYVRQWLPALQSVPTKTIHKPWESGLALMGKHYPNPIVEHFEARDKALAAFKQLRADG